MGERTGLVSVWRALAAGKEDRAELRARIEDIETTLAAVQARLAKIEALPAVKAHL